MKEEISYTVKKYYKILILCAVFSALIIIIMLLAACGTDEKGSDTSDTTQAATDSAAKDSENSSGDDSIVTDKVNEPVESTKTQDAETGEPTPNEPDKDTIVYVALGDSICRGYDLENADVERYSARLREMLADNMPSYNYVEYNYGVNGQTSSELFDYISSDNAPMLYGADIVTISIGANNVLLPTIDMIAQYSALSTVTDDSLRDVSLSSLLTSFTLKTDNGIANFSVGLPKIITSIRKFSPDAKIIMQTIYNPYKSIDDVLNFGDTTISVREKADELVGRINNIIKENAAPLGYMVADVYSAFADVYDVINTEYAENDAFAGYDPHPNEKGHKIIAETIFSVLTK